MPVGRLRSGKVRYEADQALRDSMTLLHVYGTNRFGFDGFDGFLGMEHMMQSKAKRQSTVEAQALRLLNDPQFLYKAGQKIGDLGVVGEERNRLVIFLAGVSRTTPNPASVLVKGATSSGKTTLVKSPIRLFPADCVMERSGLSGKALAHGEGSLAGKILFIHEYRCGKDSQLLLRLIQSDGRIKHEFAIVSGADRSTRVVERVGMPVVLSTTTQTKVFEDDETRFLSLWADESPEQNLAILIARAERAKLANDSDLPVWQMATSLLTYKSGDFEEPPSWLRYVAERLPLMKVRVRRDWDRFLSFCSAIALCRTGGLRDRPVDLTFADYCVAYQIFEPVFAATLRGVRTQEVDLGRAVAKLNKRLQRAATVREIADKLKWKESLVYKYLPRTVSKRLVEYEPGPTKESNTKRVLAIEDGTEGFLPPPVSVLRKNPEIGKKVEYFNPFTGEEMVITTGN